jgi:prepilin-type N-terminal cleavage/methylation domain-containing protein
MVSGGILKYNFRKFGYTLIELMVSIGILALLAAITAPAIGKAKQAQELQQATLGFKAKIIEMQSIALSPPLGNNGIQYYGLKIDNSPFSYQPYKTKCLPISSTCPATVNSTTATSFSTVKTDLTGSEYIWFKVSNNPEVTFTNSVNPNWQGKLNLSNNTETRQITINSITGAVDVR